ncbi:MAG: hypothetical protein PHI63_05595 [Patescibacteria group bacterium]|nr:hypothetical protein [Patescibacteria group bacterium]
MGVIDKLFGGIKTGRQFKKEGVQPLQRDQSFRAAFHKLRSRAYGGYEGRNLTEADADAIADLIEPHLKNLPPGDKLSIGTRQNIRGKLWSMVRGGKISQQDFDDAKKILDQF